MIKYIKEEGIKVKLSKILRYVFVAVFMVSALFICAQAKDIYVDKMNGSNGNGYDGTILKPYRTIQKGVDSAGAGDTVIVRQAVYPEFVHIKSKGTANDPITVIAEPGTIITGANWTIRSNPGGNRWTNENFVDKHQQNLNVYSASLELNTGDTGLIIPSASELFPTRVLMDETDLLQYPTLEALKTFVLNQNDNYTLDGFSYGYYYDAVNKKIYVRLPGTDKNPNNHVMKVSPTYYKTTSLGTSNYGVTPGYGSYNLLVGDKYTLSAPVADSEPVVMPSYHVIIDGFTFETPGLAGVLLRASDVEIKNCKFLGCRYGVKGATRVIYDMAYCTDICINNCEYSQYPTYDEAVDFTLAVRKNEKTATNVPYPWWHKKSNGLSAYGIDANLRYEVGGLVGNMGERWEIKNNNIHDVFDGINGSAMTKYYEKYYNNGVLNTRNVGAEDIDIHHNRFEKCLDNCIEFEEHGKNVRVYNNEFINNFIPVSSQPTKGPEYPTDIYVYKNLFYNDAEVGRFWSQTANKATFAFKIGAKTTNWTFPWSENPPTGYERAVINLTGDGFNAYNNTMILPWGYPIAFTISNSDSWQRFCPLFVNMRFRNNVLVCHVKEIPTNPTGSYTGDLNDTSIYWDGISASGVGGVGSYIMNIYPVDDVTDPDYPGVTLGIEYSGNIFAPDEGTKNISSIFTATGGANVDNKNGMMFHSFDNLDFGASTQSPIFTAVTASNLFGVGAYAGAVAPGEHYVGPSVPSKTIGN